jgi:crotonobetainyl-CoA:carnitine CoA-transferase CaiB-like acyl-CoA transferase
MVDASLYGAQLFLAAPAFQDYLATGSEKYSKQHSRKDAENPLCNTYPAEDGWIFLCLENRDENWSRLCQSLDDADLAKDARFDAPEKRRQNAAELIDLLDRALPKRSAGEWMERWKPLGIVASPIGTLADVAEDPQAWANDYFLETYCEEVQRQVKVRGLPVGLSKTPGAVRSLGPELGQDTELILADTLGYSWDEIGEFKAKGAIP